MRIKIFTTGGSLDKGYSARESAFTVQEPQIGKVLQEANVGCSCHVEPLFKKDSLEITEEDRELVVQRVRDEPLPRVVVTHGTDTMIQTGLALLGIPAKTIVLTGSMQPAAFRQTDAHFNIGFAMAAVQTLSPGVYIAMNGLVFDPRRTRKNMDLDRFEAFSPS